MLYESLGCSGAAPWLGCSDFRPPASDAGVAAYQPHWSMRVPWRTGPACYASKQGAGMPRAG